MSQEKPEKDQKLLEQRNKTCFFSSDLLPCYLRGCFWRAWWTVEYVADISFFSLLEFVSQIFPFYPDKIGKTQNKYRHAFRMFP